MIKYGELESVWMEAVVAYFKVLSRVCSFLWVQFDFQI
jgi:hypothetical protein